MLGFPKDDDTIGGLFGVNEEDRHAWAKERQMRLERQQMQKPGLAKKATMAAYEIAAAGITSQMRAAYTEEARGTIPNLKRFDGRHHLVATNSVANGQCC